MAWLIDVSIIDGLPSRYPPEDLSALGGDRRRCDWCALPFQLCQLVLCTYCELICQFTLLRWIKRVETVVKVIIIMNRCNDYGNCHCSIFVDPLHSYFASYIQHRTGHQYAQNIASQDISYFENSMHRGDPSILTLVLQWMWLLLSSLRQMRELSSSKFPVSGSPVIYIYIYVIIGASSGASQWAIQVLASSVLFVKIACGARMPAMIDIRFLMHRRS